MTTSPAPAAEPTAARPRWMLPVVLIATFMAQFDLYVVNVALPVIHQELAMSEVWLELVVSGYAFAYAAGLIVGGRLGDHVGHRRMYVLGMVGFGIASLACGLASNGEQLVAFRLAQGAAAAMMVPQVLALISAAYPPAERGHALSWFGVIIGVGAIAGQVVGGLLLQADVAGLGWRAIFLVNVPIAVLTVLLAARALPAGGAAHPESTIDVAGAVGVIATLVLVLVPLTFGHSAGWPAWCFVMLLAAAGVGAATLAVEGRRERRGVSPIVPPSLFGERAFTVGLLLSLTQFGAFFSLVFCLTLVLQNGIGLSPMQAGFAFAPLGCGFAAASIGMRGVVRRRGAAVIIVGSVVVAVAMGAIAYLAATQGSNLTVLDVVVPLAVVGLGNGAAIPAVIGQVLQRIRPVHAGAAAGLLTTAQQFASALGIALVGAVFFAHLSSTSLGGYAYAVSRAASVDASLMVLAVALAVVLARTAQPRKWAQ